MNATLKEHFMPFSNSYARITRLYSVHAVYKFVNSEISHPIVNKIKEII